jgi:hypothetical protein
MPSLASVYKPASTSFVAECFWPGVSEDDLEALDERAAASADELRRDGRPVRYVGSILMRKDEVVLCRFEGPAGAVREAAERARVPFERILETTSARRAPEDNPDFLTSELSRKEKER